MYNTLRLKDKSSEHTAKQKIHLKVTRRREKESNENK